MVLVQLPITFVEKPTKKHIDQITRLRCIYAESANHAFSCSIVPVVPTPPRAAGSHRSAM